MVTALAREQEDSRRITKLSSVSRRTHGREPGVREGEDEEEETERRTEKFCEKIGWIRAAVTALPPGSRGQFLDMSIV